MAPSVHVSESQWKWPFCCCIYYFYGFRQNAQVWNLHQFTHARLYLCTWFPWTAEDKINIPQMISVLFKEKLKCVSFHFHWSLHIHLFSTSCKSVNNETKQKQINQRKKTQKQWQETILLLYYKQEKQVTSLVCPFLVPEFYRREAKRACVRIQSSCSTVSLSSTR